MTKPRETSHPDLYVAELFVAERSSMGHGWKPRPVRLIELTAAGIRGDMHERASRVVRPHESEDLRGTTVINDRAVTIADVESMSEIAHGLGVDKRASRIEDATGQPLPVWMAGQLAVNVLLDSTKHVGVNNVFQPGYIAAFGSVPDKTTAQLFIRSYNPPCRQPAGVIMDSLEQLGIDPGMDRSAYGARFVEVAEGNRGWVAYPRSAPEVQGNQAMRAPQIAISGGQNVYIETPYLPPQ